MQWDSAWVLSSSHFILPIVEICRGHSLCQSVCGLVCVCVCVCVWCVCVCVCVCVQAPVKLTHLTNGYFLTEANGHFQGYTQPHTKGTHTHTHKTNPSTHKTKPSTHRHTHIEASPSQSPGAVSPRLSSELFWHGTGKERHQEGRTARQTCNEEAETTQYTALVI